MYSRRGLLRKLRKLAAGEEFGATQHTLLVTAIDWYTGIRRKSGETVSRGLVGAAARAIRRAVGESAVSAYLGDGRFATLLVGQSLVAAKAAAEILAKDFASRESHHESIPRPTLTSAIAPWAAGNEVDRFLNDALETLDLAVHSGGDCVLQQGDFSKELTAWQHEMATGNPFANVVAQDIMEPFPAVLQRDADQSELAEALRRSGIPVRPFVDSDGRLVGVAVDALSAAETRIGEVAGAATTELTTPETIAHDASFPEIYEAFSSRGCATLVVTADEHPLGYLTCDGVLSMIDPINSESFAGNADPTDDLDYLVVPSTSGEVVEEVGV
jgi:GGDEF domain-containing protein